MIARCLGLRWQIVCAAVAKTAAGYSAVSAFAASALLITSIFALGIWS